MFVENGLHSGERNDTPQSCRDGASRGNRSPLMIESAISTYSSRGAALDLGESPRNLSRARLRLRWLSSDNNGIREGGARYRRRSCSEGPPARGGLP